MCKGLFFRLSAPYIAKSQIVCVKDYILKFLFSPFPICFPHSPFLSSPMCMYYHIYSFIFSFLFISKFSFLYFFPSLIIVFPHDCHKSIPKNTKYWRKILIMTLCGNFLPKLIPLSICWFLLEKSTRSHFSHCLSRHLIIEWPRLPIENNMTRELSGFKTGEP